jgi:polysaccharide biosynthesis protein PslJ
MLGPEGATSGPLTPTPSRSFAPAFILAAIGILAAATVAGVNPKYVAPIVVIAVVVAAWHGTLFRWHNLVGLILVVVMFVPIGRYSLPANLPFNLELYRLVVGLVVGVWIASMLIDSRVKLRSTPFDRPLLLIVACVLASEVVNPSEVDAVSSFVAKSLTFFLSFILVYYVIATTVRERTKVVYLLKLFTLGGTLIGAAAIYEQRSGYNIFDHVGSVFPLLHFEGALATVTRGGNRRVFGPAEDPIALGAALALIVPISIYFGRTSARRWYIASLLLVLGALASESRTAITMFLAELVVFLWLKPKETRRLWPLLVPAVVVVHLFLPGTIGAFKEAFFPKGGVIAQETQLAPGDNPQLAGGRIRELSPELALASRHIPFGQGFGTRITGFNVPQRNAPILDNQWLDNAVEIGFLGVALWLWLIIGSVRRLVRASRESDVEGDDWLFTALAASITAFAVGMLTYDAFSFTQVFFFFWIILGLSASMLEVVRRRPRAGLAVPSG